MTAASWRGLILIVVLAALAGFVGASFGVKATHSHTPGTVSPVTVRQAVHALLDRDFKLTEAQKAQIHQIDQKFTLKHNLIWADIRMSNAELASAVATDMTLNQEAQNAIMEIQASIGRLHTESILYVLEVRKVLTPQQRTQFDERIIMALMRDPT